MAVFILTLSRKLDTFKSLIKLRENPEGFRRMKKQWIFSYGTLQDSEIQRSLFGYCLIKQKARLSGWSVFTSNKDGYLFIKPETSGFVEGYILEVDVHAIQAMDQWEEIPYYRREKVLVTLEDDTSLQVWAYTRRNGNGTPYPGTGLSTKDRKSVLTEMKSLKKQKEGITLPFSDVYIMVPCTVISKKSLNIQDKNDYSAHDIFLQTLTAVSKTEKPGLPESEMKHHFFADIEIITYSKPLNGLRSEHGRQRIKTYLMTNADTEPAVITFVIPACSVSAQDLLYQMNRKDLRISIPDKSSLIISLAEWIKGRGLQLAGSARALLIFSSDPAPRDLHAILDGKSDPADESILSGSFSQQKNSRIYVSETCRVEIPFSFAETFEERLSEAGMTLFKTGLSMIQN